MYIQCLMAFKYLDRSSASMYHTASPYRMLRFRGSLGDIHIGVGLFFFFKERHNAPLYAHRLIRFL